MNKSLFFLLLSLLQVVLFMVLSIVSAMLSVPLFSLSLVSAMLNGMAANNIRLPVYIHASLCIFLYRDSVAECFKDPKTNQKYRKLYSLGFAGHKQRNFISISSDQHRSKWFPLLPWASYIKLPKTRMHANLSFIFKSFSLNNHCWLVRMTISEGVNCASATRPRRSTPLNHNATDFDPRY